MLLFCKMTHCSTTPVFYFTGDSYGLPYQFNPSALFCFAFPYCWRNKDLDERVKDSRLSSSFIRNPLGITLAARQKFAPIQFFHLNLPILTEAKWGLIGRKGREGVYAYRFQSSEDNAFYMCPFLESGMKIKVRRPHNFSLSNWISNSGLHSCRGHMKNI